MTDSVEDKRRAEFLEELHQRTNREWAEYWETRDRWGNV
jgi:hypothetical protein